MDELVFTRERLRRLIIQTDKALVKAAETYNPEDALPFDDILVALLLKAVHEATREYSKSLMVHGANVSGDEGLKQKLKEQGIDT